MTLHLASLNRMSLSSRSRFPSISHRTHFETRLVCAERRRRGRKNRVGYQRFATFLLNSLSPNLQILPQPLDLIIADLGGGRGGGGLGFWRGWGGFDGWRRKRNRLPILFFVCVILWIYGYCKISGKEVLGVCLFALALLTEVKREATFLFFEFLCFSASLLVGFKKEDFVKLAPRFRSASSLLFHKRTSRRRV